MKKVKVSLLLGLSLLLLNGCGALIPKHVEFFQRKVKAVPELSETGQEHERQAAQFVAKQVEASKIAAIATKADPSVIAPVMQASEVADALSEILGPPNTPWPFDVGAEPLAQALHHDEAKLNAEVAAYREKVEKDVGKKIEGTGFINVSYFTYIGCIVGLGILVWFGLKAYGMFNPAVGLGVNTVGRLSSAVVSKGFSELVAGGEAFKQYLENSPLTDDVKAYVNSLFSQAHTSNQSQDIQKIVSTLTDNPAAVVVPPLAPVPTSTPSAVALTPVIPKASLPPV